MAEQVKLVASWGRKLTQFLTETRGEVKKVVWPSKKYVSVASVLVIVISILAGVFVMVVDFGFTWLFKLLSNLF